MDVVSAWDSLSYWDGILFTFWIGLLYTYKVWIDNRWKQLTRFKNTASIAFDMQADEIKHKFKSPSFSGVGTSSHYLTIDSQEITKKDAVKAEIKALADAAKREEENTTLARFIKNFESRIYAQLSRQLVDSLFGENPAEEGSFQLFDNLITWTSDGITITMTIFNEATGETTTITIPIGDFGFQLCNAQWLYITVHD